MGFSFVTWVGVLRFLYEVFAALRLFGFPLSLALSRKGRGDVLI
jgi:hypothetical protein